jgi:hypothetical protein
MASRIFKPLSDLFRLGQPREATPSAPKTLRAANGILFIVEQTRRGGMGIVYICRVEHDDHDDQSGRQHRLALKTFDEQFFFKIEMSLAVQRETAIWTRLTDVPFVVPLITVLTSLTCPCLPPSPTSQAQSRSGTRSGSHRADCLRCDVSRRPCVWRRPWPRPIR